MSNTRNLRGIRAAGRALLLTTAIGVASAVLPMAPASAASGATGVTCYEVGNRIDATTSIYGQAGQWVVAQARVKIASGSTFKVHATTPWSGPQQIKVYKVNGVNFVLAAVSFRFTSLPEAIFTVETRIGRWNGSAYVYEAWRRADSYTQVYPGQTFTMFGFCES
jgi:hypothetical protein